MDVIDLNEFKDVNQKVEIFFDDPTLKKVFNNFIKGGEIPDKQLDKLIAEMKKVRERMRDFKETEMDIVNDPYLNKLYKKFNNGNITDEEKSFLLAFVKYRNKDIARICSNIKIGKQVTPKEEYILEGYKKYKDINEAYKYADKKLKTDAMKSSLTLINNTK